MAQMLGWALLLFRKWSAKDGDTRHFQCSMINGLTFMALRVSHVLHDKMDRVCSNRDVDSSARFRPLAGKNDIFSISHLITTMDSVVCILLILDDETNSCFVRQIF